MISLLSTISDQSPDIVENRDIIEFHDNFGTKKEGLSCAALKMQKTMVLKSSPHERVPKPLKFKVS